MTQPFMLNQPYIMVSPAEPITLRAIGHSHPLPEKYGADFLWSAQGGLWGVQRKAFPDDFLASRSHMETYKIKDPETGKPMIDPATGKDKTIQIPEDRLVREIQQLQACRERFLLLEGFGTWLPNGFLQDSFRQYTITQLTEFLVSIQVRPEFNISVLWSPDLCHTADIMRYLVKWSVKHEPTSSLIRRIKPLWGTATSRDWKRHALMGVEGVGPITADAILDSFGGELPWHMSCDEKRLRQVPGVGPELAKKFCNLFPRPVPASPSNLEVNQCPTTSPTLPNSDPSPAAEKAEPAAEKPKAKRARKRKNVDLDPGPGFHAVG